VLDPHSIHIGQVSLGSTGLLQPDSETIIFLGHLYPYSVLQGVGAPLPDSPALFADLMQPNPGRLLSLLSVGETNMRALYMHMHWLLERERIAGKLSVPQITRLMGERSSS
jgi:hypothetical protein